MIRRNVVGALALVAIIGVSVVALAGRMAQAPSVEAGGGKEIPRVTVTLRESGIEAPAAVPTGMVAITSRMRRRISPAVLSCG